MRTITCSGCGHQKPEDAFYKSAIYEGGTRGRCRLCAIKSSAEYAKAHPEKIKEMTAVTYKKWRERHPLIQREPLHTAAGKLCRTCGFRKSLEDFVRHASAKDGRTHRCRTCASLMHAKWRSENPEHVRDYSRGTARKARLADPTRTRRENMRGKYKLTPQDIERMHTDQEGRCDICKNEILLANAGGNRGIAHVDHCHITKKIRGLLCFSCNTAIGHLKDDPEILRSAIAYLEKHG